MANNNFKQALHLGMKLAVVLPQFGIRNSA